MISAYLIVVKLQLENLSVDYLTIIY
jgi:hypothetical protein